MSNTPLLYENFGLENDLDTVFEAGSQIGIGQQAVSHY